MKLGTEPFEDESFDYNRRLSHNPLNFGSRRDQKSYSSELKDWVTWIRRATKEPKQLRKKRVLDFAFLFSSEFECRNFEGERNERLWTLMYPQKIMSPDVHVSLFCFYYGPGPPAPKYTQKLIATSCCSDFLTKVEYCWHKFSIQPSQSLCESSHLC